MKTILNRVQKFKLFVYISVRWSDETETALEIEVQPRKKTHPDCSVCGRSRPGYDRLPARRFKFVPLWGLEVFLVYAPRRVDCPICGGRVEGLPWTLWRRIPKALPRV